ncbi:unnamed protein product [Aspergillus oryzae]|uniref:Unnamed protein product n=1 Tax=Aspergillus oryzae TaxID=5062 RepID=A0AAN5BXQ6_ASPOZ|nr:unnamed protein product [Aspergillus oryzae]
MPPNKSVAVIGTGPAGAIAVDALVQEKSFDVVRVFERQEKAGGCWTADGPVPIPDNLPRHVPTLSQHRYFDSHVYPTLHANVAASVMEYSQEQIPDILSEWSVNIHGPDTPFRHHTVIRQYIEDLLNRNGYQDFVEYNTTVERAEKDPQTGKWTLTLRRAGEPNGLDYWWTETFDALVVASGHYAVPYVPVIKGLKEFAEKYPGSVEHTKQYRGPEKYKGKRVITVGASVSAADTAVSLVNHAKGPVYAVVRGKYNTYFGDEAFKHPQIERRPPISHITTDNGARTVHFENGTSVSDVDHIIFGTGFTWTLPFLPNIPIRNNRVPDLYLHVFHQRDPSLVFLGALPSLEEQRKWEQDRIAKKGDGPGFMMINPDFEAYFVQLRQLAGEPAEGEPGRRLPPFKQQWVDDFNAGHERRIRMWKKANEAGRASKL